MQATRYVCDFPGCGKDAAWHMSPYGANGGETMIVDDPGAALQNVLGTRVPVGFDLCDHHARDAVANRSAFAESWKAAA